MQDWEKSTKRKLEGGWVDPADLPKGENGRALCRWCSLEVPKGRRTFCSDFCVHEWKLRSNPGYLRECLLKRDRGICAMCGADTLQDWRILKRSRGERRVLLLGKWGMTRLHRKSLWDADHILPVHQGGGECDLSNLRTLCLRCHRAVTRPVK
ncbi:MAG: HNH endonuclease [Bryobacterales bacterium]|nr:HNH endonuclease [Bryobacterales bacterium]